MFECKNKDNNDAPPVHLKKVEIDGATSSRLREEAKRINFQAGFVYINRNRDEGRETTVYDHSVVDGVAEFKTTNPDDTIRLPSSCVKTELDVADDECVMLFGPSGSGKTFNTIKIMTEYIRKHPDFQIEAQVVYGNAEINKGLHFTKVTHGALNIKGTHGVPPNEIATQIVHGTMAALSNVHDGSTVLQDKKFDLIKKTETQLVKQTINNPQSSRCLTVYTLTSPTTTDKLRLLDAPGNELAIDLVRGMYSTPEGSDDDVVQGILNKTTVKGNHVNGTHAYTRHLKDDNWRILKTAYTNAKRDMTITVLRKGAWVPYLEKNASLTDDEHAEYQTYCATLIKESLFINFLVGEMVRNLPYAKEPLMRTLVPFATATYVNHHTQRLNDYHFDVTRRCLQTDKCDNNRLRAVYEPMESVNIVRSKSKSPRSSAKTDEKSPRSPAKTNDENVIMNKEDMDAAHKQYRDVALLSEDAPKDHTIEDILHIRELLKEYPPEKRKAIVVVPTHSSNDLTAAIVQRGFKSLTEHLIGVMDD